MKKFDRRSWIAAACLALGASLTTPVWADEYQDTINVFKKAPATGKFFANAYGYAVYPTIGKAGVGLGGAHGTGRVYEKGKYIGDTSMTQVSVGFQIGAQGYSQMIFFENAAALKKFTAGEFEFTADASAIALTVGASAKAGTTGAGASASVEKERAATVATYNDGIAVFTIAKGGLMYEVALAGQKYKYKKKA